VAKRDLGGLADRREVDRRIPGEQQPDVIVDRQAGRGWQGQVELGQTGLEGNDIVRRQGRKALNARRERLTRTVQALSLSAVPVRPVPAPLPASSFIAPVGRGSRSSVASPVRGRVSPCPSQAPLPERSRCG
jgi:hypothetical protein